MKNPTFSHPISCMGNQAGFPSPLFCFFDKVLAKRTVTFGLVSTGWAEFRVYKYFVYQSYYNFELQLVETNKRDKCSRQMIFFFYFEFSFIKSSKKDKVN